MIHWLWVAVWGAKEQPSLPQALISFPGAGGMTSGFGSLPGVMHVLLDLFTSWFGAQVSPQSWGATCFSALWFQALFWGNVALLVLPLGILQNLSPWG